MKIAMVLPLFSEHYFRDYLGINLIVNTLEKNQFQVDCIDLNEKLADYLLSDKSLLSRLALAKKNAPGVKNSPYSRFFDLYHYNISKYDTAKSLKEERLFDYFFKNIVLNNLDVKILQQDGLGPEEDKKILDSVPILNSF